MKRILFVCLGNICRSPAAEAVLRAKSAARGVALHIESAGTGGWHAGDGADPRMIRAAARRGYGLDLHKARQVAFSDFYEFDFVLAMDKRNEADLLALAPPNRDCDIRLFLDFAGGQTRETPDPYYGRPEGFDLVLDLMEAGAEGFLEQLEKGCG
jgi:protein-tyrosine phosphatase